MLLPDFHLLASFFHLHIQYTINTHPHTQYLTCAWGPARPSEWPLGFAPPENPLRSPSCAHIQGYVLYVQEVVTLQQKYLIYLHQKMRFTPFINYYDTLGWILFVYKARYFRSHELNIELNYFIQLSSCHLKLFFSINE